MGRYDISMFDSELKKMFDKIDVDKNGCITLEGKLTIKYKMLMFTYKLRVLAKKLLI